MKRNTRKLHLSHNYFTPFITQSFETFQNQNTATCNGAEYACKSLFGQTLYEVYLSYYQILFRNVFKIVKINDGNSRDRNTDTTKGILPNSENLT